MNGPVSDQERDALAEVIRTSCTGIAAPRHIADAVLAAGWRPPGTDTSDTVREALAQTVNEFSALLDGTYPPSLDDETHRWRRVAKVNEEAGEVIEALLGSVSENPRKGASHTLQDVYKELLDVAFCALAACAHLNHNHGDVIGDLAQHAASTHARLQAALRDRRAPHTGQTP